MDPDTTSQYDADPCSIPDTRSGYAGSNVRIWTREANWERIRPDPEHCLKRDWSARKKFFFNSPSWSWYRAPPPPSRPDRPPAEAPPPSGQSTVYSVQQHSLRRIGSSSSTAYSVLAQAAAQLVEYWLKQQHSLWRIGSSSSTAYGVLAQAAAQLMAYLLK